MAGLILGVPSIVKMKLERDRKKVRTMSLDVNILTGICRQLNTLLLQDGGSVMKDKQNLAEDSSRENVAKCCRLT